MTDAMPLLSQHFATTYHAWVRITETFKGDIARLKDESFLTERPATKLILTWMQKLGEFQTKFGKLFGRAKRPPQADEFTAAVAICLEQFLAGRGFAGRVACEETTHRVRGAKRPDVSVFSLAGKCVATVECKTNLGWNRKNWKDEIDKRTQFFHTSFPGSDFFLCVLTRSNWDYSAFEGSPLCGKQWFCLSTVSVGRISDPVADSDIMLPVEPMFLDILTKLSDALAEQIRQMPPDAQQKALEILGKGGNA